MGPTLRLALCDRLLVDLSTAYVVALRMSLYEDRSTEYLDVPLEPSWTAAVQLMLAMGAQ